MFYREYAPNKPRRPLADVLLSSRCFGSDAPRDRRRGSGLVAWCMGTRVPEDAGAQG
jgi:hypothetical protein